MALETLKMCCLDAPGKVIAEEPVVEISFVAPSNRSAEFCAILYGYIAEMERRSAGEDSLVCVTVMPIDDGQQFTLNFARLEDAEMFAARLRRTFRGAESPCGQANLSAWI